MPCGLTATELVEVWDRGQALPPPRRARLLLRAAQSVDAADDFGGWTAGQRDAALLALRRRTFGAALDAVAACPGCAAALEVRVPVADLASEAGTADTVVAVSSGRFRVPTLDDLDAAATPADLLARCRVSGEAAVDAAAVETAMAEADPQGLVELALRCDACGHAWAAALDVVDYVWQEIDMTAHRLLKEVHTLATAYGWREAEILALSPLRRAMYLSQVAP